MATIKRFEDLEVWQLARKLNVDLSPLIDKLAETKNFTFRNQLDGSAGSVMDNIAEGFERDGNKELGQFLAISKGSLGEVRSQLYRAFDKNLIDAERFAVLQSDCLGLAGKIASFMSYLKKSEFKGNKYKD